MEVELSEEQQQLVERAARQQGITVEQFMQNTTQEFLQQRLGKPASHQRSKPIFSRPKPTCH